MEFFQQKGEKYLIKSNFIAFFFMFNEVFIFQAELKARTKIFIKKLLGWKFRGKINVVGKFETMSFEPPYS